MNNIDDLITALRFSYGYSAIREKAAADAIETLQSENISLRAERDALLKAVEKPCVQERGD